jgi:hypothetical protein
VNRDQFDKRSTSAIHHWWVTMRDTGKVAPGLLDDLWNTTVEHARDVLHAQADEQAAINKPRGEPHTEAPAPLLVAAAVPFAATGGNGSQADTVTTGGNDSTHRTRTRTRGGPK